MEERKNDDSATKKNNDDDDITRHTLRPQKYLKKKSLGWYDYCDNVRKSPDGTRNIGNSLA